MTLSEDLQWRGLIKDKTFEDMAWLDEPQTFYLGQDCNSADSLTIGNLAICLLARRLVEAGWKPVLLVGGATSMIGDPGGKNEERELKNHDEIAKNVAGIKTQVQKLFAGREFQLVDNYDWFKDMGYLEFLREVGKHYSMTELTQRDFIAARMGEGGSGISYAEFSYSLVQGYDYWYLFKHYGVTLQIGGSDQWGNMLSGAPLIRKKEGQEAHALSMPLVVNKATGRKFGKSEEGAVWLDPAKTSPTQFYQFWINADDAGVEDYLKIYTLLSKEEIEAILAEHRSDPSQRFAQKRLAAAVTDLVHGKEVTTTQQTTARIVSASDTTEGLDDASLHELEQQFQVLSLASDAASIIDALAGSGLAASKSDARRLLQSGGVYVNGRQVSGREQFTAADFYHGKSMLRKGKKFKDMVVLAVSVGS